MKSLFIIIVLVFLSCIDKETSPNNEAETAAIAIAEIVEIENSSSETTFEETDTNSEDYQVIRKVLYKGTLNGNIKITLYLNEQEHPCGGNLTILNAMYSYDNQDKWLLLNVTTDKDKKNYCMVEDGFTGVLFLENNEGSFYGNWISPSTRKQYKVELENQFLDLKYAKDHSIIEELDDILFDDLIYGKNDC